MPAKVWLICIPGFQSSRDDETGIVRLYQRLTNAYRNSNVEVLLREWNDNFDALAARIARDRDEANGDGIQVRIFAHSWGVGCGAMKLARKLEGYGVQIQHVVSADGVYRSAWFLGRLRSMIPPLRPHYHDETRRGKLRAAFHTLLWAAGRVIPRLCPIIRVPCNVRLVTPFRQRFDLPMGHDWEAHSEGTKIANAAWLQKRHGSVDDDKIFKLACIESAEQAMKAAGLPGGAE